jgi:hypothetical protein
MMRIKTLINQPLNIKPNYVKEIYRKNNSKLSPLLSKKLSHEGIWGTTGITSCIFLIWTLHVGERSASRPCRFIAGEREPIRIKSKIWEGGGCV